MILSKLNLVNKKISNFLKIDINALAWILTVVMISFIIAGSLSNFSDRFEEKHKDYLTQVKADLIKNYGDGNINTDIPNSKKSVFAEMFIFLIIWLGAGSWFWVYKKYGSWWNFFLCFLSILIFLGICVKILSFFFK